MYRYHFSRLPGGCRWRWLPAGLLAAGLAQAAPGQPPAALEYRSALEHYQRYRDASIAPWRATNDQAGRPDGGHDHAPSPAAEGAPPADSAAGGQHAPHRHHHHQHHQQETRP